MSNQTRLRDRLNAPDERDLPLRLPSFALEALEDPKRPVDGPREEGWLASWERLLRGFAELVVRSTP